jgi:hypothetical protein
MNLRGVSVYHNVFGEGIIKQCDENYLVVSFSQGDKKFVYPDVFENFISVNDTKIAEFIHLEIDKRKRNKLKQQDITNENMTEYADSWDNIFDLNSIMEDFFPKRETLLSIKREQTDKIKEIVKRRKIEYLVHFTRIDNLNSILENGLIPVSMQQKMKIPSVHNDEQRIDSKLDCTSCSISFPNYKLFYTFREYKFPESSWVVIVLDKDVLFSPSNITYFCQTNAARVFPRISSAKELCTATAFENMFCNSLTTKENKVIQRASLQINDCITTDPQAEILISDVIDKKYIGCICFQKQSDIDEYITKYGKGLLSKYDYQVVPGFFDARKDYMFWKKES